jgi:lysyl-tRNA synthetase class 2
MAALRAWFMGQGFVEVETGALALSPGNETHLHAFSTKLVRPSGAPRELYLRTSPEFACKKLLAAGERRLFEFARVFRNRERGALHSAEFTMLEWYRADEPYAVLVEDCVAILREAASAAGAKSLRFREASLDPFAAPERLSVVEAFSRYADIDLLATLPDGAPDREAFARAADTAGIRRTANDSWADIFSRVLVERVEPRLGHGRATVLDQYPAVLSALARPAADPRLAERFELYACGVELANGFGEQTDAKEQRRRLEEEMAEKFRRYGERYPIDEDFIAALSRLPPASGIALGLDRLVMLATGAQRIDQVQWAPLPDLD